MYRVSENPPSRYPEGRPLEEDIGNWAVGRLLSRREKMVAHEFMESGIGYYLPLYEKRTRRKDTGKPRKTINPLFPGYIAIVHREEIRQDLLFNKNISGIIPVKDQHAFVFELRQVQRILDAGVDVLTHVRFVPGTRVRMTSGPFTDVEGVVVDHEGQKRLVVGIEMFGQAVSVRIDEFQVEKAR